MRVIGLTGGVGSGKSRILDILRDEYGAFVIQADHVAKELMEPGKQGYEGLKAIYGSEILARDGSIDRAGLAERLFHNPQVKRTVDGIIHPLVWDKIKDMMAAAANDLVVVEAALPDENHRDIYTELWYVYTSEENRMERLLKGRGYSREKTKSVMASQMPDAKFRAMADVVIDNNGSMEGTRRQIASQLNKKRTKT